MAADARVSLARRVAVVTAGSLCTCPRMVKAADALHAAGWHVRVISVTNTPWAARLDREMHARRGWRWTPLGIMRDAGLTPWLLGGACHRLARHASDLVPRLSASAPARALTAHAFSRAHRTLVGALLEEPQDLIYGGTSGALAAVAEAAHRSGTPYALDLEDFHCEEGESGTDGARHNRLARAVMATTMPGAAFLTAGSAAIAAAVTTAFGVQALPVHNVFPLAWGVAPGPTAGPLKLYWFSQTIGAGRGLEDVVTAAGRLPRADACELHLRGVPATGYLDGLRRHVAATAPRLGLVVHEPALPDAMAEACRPFDLGLATEGLVPRNRGLTLSNKALTYPLGGLGLVLTGTPGHRAFADDLGTAVVRYAPGDVEALSDGLAWLAGDRAALGRAREMAWEAACHRWHWEHPRERDTLLAAAEATV